MKDGRKDDRKEVVTVHINTLNFFNKLKIENLKTGKCIDDIYIYIYCLMLDFKMFLRLKYSSNINKLQNKTTD